MSSWNYNTILQQAPDALVLEKAKRLARASSWEALYQNEGLIWGIGKSTGATRYEVAVDLDQMRFACSCPSTKYPCRYALALALLFAEQKEKFRYQPQTPEEIPALLAKHFAERQEAKKGEAGNTTTTTSEKNKVKRIVQMVEGARELEVWLLDVVRFGIGNQQTDGSDYLEQFAAKMVDAKLGGVARRIRQLPRLAAQANFPERMAEAVGELYLLAKALQKYEQLPENLQAELLSIAGYNQSKEAILAQAGQNDQWLVIGQQESEEENLQVRRTWLLGEQSQVVALILDFAWGNQGFPMEWVVGGVVKGTLTFYKGSYQQRALVKTFEWSTEPFQGLIGYADFEVLAGAYADALAANPWLITFPCLLEGVVPQLNDNKMVLVDQHRMMLPLHAPDAVFWQIMALSGGQGIQVFGTWNGSHLLPLTLFAEGRLIKLTV
ncbi:MAG: hypothetical protein AAF798_17255 [Bacteroidota bacterium]